MTSAASTAVIRQWARDHGFDVGDRGRLSPEVLAAYSDGPSGSRAFAKEDDRAPDRSPRGRAHGATRILVKPAPGATGIGHRVTARK